MSVLDSQSTVIVTVAEFRVDLKVCTLGEARGRSLAGRRSRLGGRTRHGLPRYVMALAFPALLVSAPIVGCGSQGSSARRVSFEPIAGPKDIPIHALSSRSGIRESREIVIRDLQSWEVFWAEHTSWLGHPLLPPVIDFAREMVAGVILGDRGQSAVAITAIRADGETLVVSFEWRIQERCPGFFYFDESPQPSVLVRLPRFDGPVRFDESVRVEGCR